MKKHKRKIAMALAAGALGASVLAFCGCSTTNISELIKASATDTNTVSISVRTIYGTIEYQRNAPGRTAQ